MGIYKFIISGFILFKLYLDIYVFIFFKGDMFYVVIFLKILKYFEDGFCRSR